MTELLRRGEVGGIDPVEVPAAALEREPESAPVRAPAHGHGLEEVGAEEPAGPEGREVLVEAIARARRLGLDTDSIRRTLAEILEEERDDHGKQ